MVVVVVVIAMTHVAAVVAVLWWGSAFIVNNAVSPRHVDVVHFNVYFAVTVENFLVGVVSLMAVVVAVAVDTVAVAVETVAAVVTIHVVAVSTIGRRKEARTGFRSGGRRVLVFTWEKRVWDGGGVGHF